MSSAHSSFRSRSPSTASWSTSRSNSPRTPPRQESPTKARTSSGGGRGSAPTSPQRHVQDVHHPHDRHDGSHHHHQYGGGGASTAPPPEAEVTQRLLTADQFRLLFQQSIAKMSAQPSSGDAHAEDEVMRAGRPMSRQAGGAGRRPQSAKKTGFIDPYNKTKFKNRIHAGPGSASKAYGAPVVSARAERLHNDIRRGRPAGGASKVYEGRGDDEKALKLQDELNDAKYRLKCSEVEASNLRKKNRELEQDMNRMQRSASHAGKPASQGASTDTMLQHLRGKVRELEMHLQEKTETLYKHQNSHKSMKVRELTIQNSALAMELDRVTEELEHASKSAKAQRESIALQEANAQVQRHDQTIRALQEKILSVKEDLRKAEAEAGRWQQEYEGDREAREASKKHLDELRQAPLEIQRLRQRLAEVEAHESKSQETLRVQQEHFEGQIDQLRREVATVQHDAEAKIAAQSGSTVERDQLRAQLDAAKKEVARLSALRDMHAKEIEEEVAKQSKVVAGDVQRLARDKELALREEIKELRADVSDLTTTLQRAKEEHKKEIEEQKAKEQTRQESLLATIGRSNMERQAEQLRLLQEREHALAQQQEALEAEKRRWEAEITRRREEVGIPDEPLRRKTSEKYPLTPTQQGLASTTSRQTPVVVANTSDLTSEVPPATPQEAPMPERNVSPPLASASPTKQLPSQSPPPAAPATGHIPSATASSTTERRPLSPEGRRSDTPPGLHDKSRGAKASAYEEDEEDAKIKPGQSRYNNKALDTQSEITVRRQGEEDDRTSHASLLGLQPSETEDRHMSADYEEPFEVED